MTVARTNIEHQPGRGQMAQDSGLMHYVGGAKAAEAVHAARAINQADLKFVVRLGLPHLVRSCQFGTSASIVPHLVRTARGPNDRTVGPAVDVLDGCAPAHRSALFGRLLRRLVANVPSYAAGRNAGHVKRPRGIVT
jgi:hypothetical protein